MSTTKSIEFSSGPLTAAPQFVSLAQTADARTQVVRFVRAYCVIPLEGLWGPSVTYSDLVTLMRQVLWTKIGLDMHTRTCCDHISGLIDWYLPFCRQSIFQRMNSNYRSAHAIEPLLSRVVYFRFVSKFHVHSRSHTNRA